MTKTSGTDDALAAIQERLEVAEAQIAELTGKMTNVTLLLGAWLDQHVAVAKQSLNRAERIPSGQIDEQTLMINARAPERQAKGRDAAVKLGDADFDGAVDRINNKRKEAQGK